MRQTGAVTERLYGAGGRACVSSSDAFTNLGLKVSPFSQKTKILGLGLSSREQAASFVVLLDMGSVSGILDTLYKTIELVIAQPPIYRFII
ncbi:MAG: hypothetical protein SWO11_18355 [Thermodesulfobacteriota bacterium]|nr:hypothetical protein [Thermodesulfobacteriota bacterium]